MQDRKRPADLEVVDAILDVWGEESFPASDPPSSLPPSVEAALAATRPPGRGPRTHRPEPRRPAEPLEAAR